MAKFDYRQADPPAPVPADWPGRWRHWLAERPQFAYILPLFAFVLLMVPGAFGQLGGIDWEKFWNQEWLPVVYPAKTILAALLLWLFWPFYTRVRWNHWWLGAIFGIAGTLLWIGAELLSQQIPFIGKPDPADIYNPDRLGGGWQEALFFCLRVAGPTLVVPFMEELFFRDFVMRSLVGGSRFEDVPVGKFTWLSFLATAGLFGINHGWYFFLPGIIYGLLIGALLVRTKSLGACIVAHGVTNFTLYVWVIYSGNWQFM